MNIQDMIRSIRGRLEGLERRQDAEVNVYYIEKRFDDVARGITSGFLLDTLEDLDKILIRAGALDDEGIWRRTVELLEELALREIDSWVEFGSFEGAEMIELEREIRMITRLFRDMIRNYYRDIVVNLEYWHLNRVLEDLVRIWPDEVDDGQIYTLREVLDGMREYLEGEEVFHIDLNSVNRDLMEVFVRYPNYGFYARNVRELINRSNVQDSRSEWLKLITKIIEEQLSTIDTSDDTELESAISDIIDVLEAYRIHEDYQLVSQARDNLIEFMRLFDELDQRPSDGSA